MAAQGRRADHREPFAGLTAVDMPVPCTHDFGLAATRYFDALEGGYIPLRFHFSNTIFYEALSGKTQVAQIPWDRKVAFRLAVETWRDLMNISYPESVLVRLLKDVFQRLQKYRSRHSLLSCELAVEHLLAATPEEAVHAR